MFIVGKKYVLYVKTEFKFHFLAALDDFDSEKLALKYNGHLNNSVSILTLPN